MSRGLPVEATSAVPGAAAATVVSRSEGRLCLTVIVKATFAFASDAPMPRADPQEILRQEIHHGKSPAQSIRFAADTAPYLGLCDVTFTGYGHSPGGQVDRLAVRLAIFDAEGTYLNKGLLLRDPKGFTRMPIVYERAYGGPGSAENPLGVGLVTGSGEPTILDPKAPKRAVGFGPISGASPARKRLLGGMLPSALARALEDGFVEIPDDFDWTYFQVAPLDQQLPYLRGDEWIALDGLHAAQPRIQMQLPGARGRAFIYGLSAYDVPEGSEIEMHADTLRIDGADKRCTVLWRGRVYVADEAALASIRVVAGVTIEGETLTAPEPPPPRSNEQRAPATTHPSLDGTMSITEEDMEIVTLQPSPGPVVVMPAAAAAAPAPVAPAPVVAAAVAPVTRAAVAPAAVVHPALAPLPMAARLPAAAPVPVVAPQPAIAPQPAVMRPAAAASPPAVAPPAAGPPNVKTTPFPVAAVDMLGKRMSGNTPIAAMVMPRAAAPVARQRLEEGTAVLPRAALLGQKPAVPFREGPVSDSFARSGLRMVVPALPVGSADAASVVSRWRGALRVTAIAKATFAFGSGGDMPLVAPNAIAAAEVHHDQSPTRSVRVGFDLAPHLERVDVLFSGHAHAPQGGPEPKVAVRLALTADAGVLFDKRLVVIGDQGPSGIVPFQKMPIVYERSFGGIGCQDNPIGVGFGGDGKRPNVVYEASGNEERPAGFGPIASTWLQRRTLLRGHAVRLLKQPIVELPDDFAWRYFQAAPDDQQVAELPARPWIVLEGLNPRQSMLQLRLPLVRAAARLHAPTGAMQTITLRADTLFIDGDAEQCTLTFRGSFSVPSEAALEGLCILAGVETRSQPLVWPRPPPPAALEPMREPVPVKARLGDTMTAVGKSVAVEKLSGTLAPSSSVPRAPPLPFAATAGQARPEAETAPIPGAPWSAVAAARPVPATEDLDSTLAFSSGVDVSAIFARESPVAAPIAPIAAAPIAAAPIAPAPMTAAPAPIEAAPVAGAPREADPPRPVDPPREAERPREADRKPEPRPADPWAKPPEAPSAPAAAPAKKAPQQTKFDGKSLLYGSGKKRA